MPQQDGTGPNGQGPRTGRGAGNCNGQGGFGGGFGRGRGSGRGMGMGVGRGLGGNVQNTSWLQTQLSGLQIAIEKLTERLDASK